MMLPVLTAAVALSAVAVVATVGATRLPTDGTVGSAAAIGLLVESLVV